ncbi:Uma2 family endonuclease [Methylomonas rapida]|uniref:Uma2 family endonuclease n=1 Tax=Methylomonas rapida TaxID=2963939 RepID=A0ABY7GHT6_9GAMM|nr:Uma2 family endonuclease [Methylomonas rapida]WAR44814.1 Uma2 family endonuclease [Methylomonas rapida]
MGFALEQDKHYTYRDYLTWPDDFRCELIDGKIYLMTPAPLLAHQDVAGEIFTQAKLALRGKSCRAFIAPVDVRLPSPAEADENTDVVVQPDVFVVCDVGKLDRRGVRGAPDWVVEVLSPSTAGKDQIEKRRIYERHGVLEYWLVHPTDRILTIYRLINGEFGKPDIYPLEEQTPVAVLPGVTIDWNELAPYLRDDDL